VDETTDNKDGQDDLAILHPERQALIAGRSIVMREYSFLETLQHAEPISALTSAMADVAKGGDLHDVDSLRAVFGQCRDIVVRLIALACDQPESWIGDLKATEGEQLLLLWWGVNAHFFLSRVLLTVQLRGVREIGGAMSTPPSSREAIGSKASGATRTGS